MSSARSVRQASTPSASLDVSALPLQSLNVIEANAGTGKTWTITALYIRLLLERELMAEHILVVTFTEAATGELRDRIRKRLAETRLAFERGHASEGDDLIDGLLNRVADRDRAILRLTSALRDFDQAPIYTIHGFCQRVLSDRAFETRLPFRSEILPDQSVLLKEIAEDFWRKDLQDASSLFTRYVIQKKITPESLLASIGGYLAKPYLEVRTPEAPPALEAIEREYERAYAFARAIWLAHRNVIADTLVNDTSLSANSYPQHSRREWLEQMHQCLSCEQPQLVLCERFDKFTREVLDKATKRGHVAPAHPFFDACGALARAHAELVDAYERTAVLMKVRLLDFCNAELAARKAQKQLQSYDDLLLNLQRALANEERGQALAAELRQCYAAALIDEFQDTDPIQYDIFRRIYGETNQPVFLVGDPKQSIYSFRGADVYSYIGARHDARAAHTLDRNWRSEPSLLTAVNEIFENAAHPFVIPDIPFVRSRSAPGNRGRLSIDRDSGAPFELWLIESENGKPLNKRDAAERAAKATAGEIARLLQLGARGEARIIEGAQERPLKGGDIAVLARTHRQTTTVREALAALGIASVQRGAQSVFSTREAEELERVLLAIAEPTREALIAAALTTEMIGMTGQALYDLRNDETRWEQTVESFREAHREWHERGFMHMLRAFVQRYGVMPRLLDHTDGERRATNLLHIAELLHCDAEREGIAGLLAWFAAKRRAPADGNEAELLRLESDENLVKLLTVHASKGLEFPVVFCPFAWDGGFRSRRADVLAFHDVEASYAAVVDFGSRTFEPSREQAIREERAESLRLLYVALTRAKYRCCMVWGNINEAVNSAPAWLLHRRSSPNADDAPANDLPRLEYLRPDLERLARRAKGSIRISPLPEGGNVATQSAAGSDSRLKPRTFVRSLHDTRQVTSFTALAHGRAIEAPDYDALDREPMLEAASSRDIFGFPRGAQAGTCIHAIFEQIDFATVDRTSLERVVARELAAHGFDAGWLRVIADMVEGVIDTPLDGKRLRLRTVTRERRLDELEFYYPIWNVSDAKLRRLLVDAGFPGEIRERIGALAFHPTQGYMRGFIDLVFEHEGRYYLADYKSNWLGSTISAYARSDLAKAIGREAYYLQYLLYCVALHRYLGSRLQPYRYDSHFGGVHYLFVRAMRPASGNAYGVYSDKPSQTLIDALDQYLRTGAL